MKESVAVLSFLLLAGPLLASPAEMPPDEGWLGVVLTAKAPEGLEMPEGAVALLEVMEGSPAEAAGLLEGDIVLEFDNRPLRGLESFVRKVRALAPGDRATVRVLRDGRERVLEAVMGERPEEVTILRRHGHWPHAAMKGLMLCEEGEDCQVPFVWKEKMHNFFQQNCKEGEDCPAPFALKGDLKGFFVAGGPRIGIRIEPLTEQLAGYFGVDHGLLVADVDEDSPAERAGLQAGDVLVRAGDREIRSHGDLVAAIRESGAGETLGIDLVRRGREVHIEVVPEEADEKSGQSLLEDFFFQQRDASGSAKHLQEAVESYRKALEMQQKSQQAAPRRIQLTGGSPDLI